MEEHSNEKMAKTRVLKLFFEPLVQYSFLLHLSSQNCSPQAEAPPARGSHRLWLEGLSGPNFFRVPLLLHAPPSLIASLSQVQVPMEPPGVGVLSLSNTPSIFKPFPLFSPTPPHPQFNVPPLRFYSLR